MILSLNRADLLTMPAYPVRDVFKIRSVGQRTREKADIKACEAAISVGYGEEAQRRERLLQPFDARMGVLRTSLRVKDQENAWLSTSLTAR
jgi:hypothetical protein